MALLFMDSFDHYTSTDLLEKWTTSSATSGNGLAIAAGGGRRGSSSFRWANSLNSGLALAAIYKQLVPADATCVAGFAVLVPTAFVGTAGLQIAVIRDGSTNQVSLRVNQDFTLSVCRGAHNGTVLGSTSAALSAATYYFLEWKVLIHPSAGTVDVRINGVSALSLTGQNTRNSASSQWSTVALGVVDGVANSYLSGTQQVHYDDLYVLDGSGSTPWNDCLGDCRVDVRLPTAAGAAAGWTPSTGANWQNVDDAAPNDDTDYNAAATVGLTDTLVVQDAPVVGAAIYGVQVNLSVKKTDAGTCSLASVVRQGTTNLAAPAQNPGTTYAYLRTVYQVNPHTSAQWTETDFNADEFGYTRTA